MDNNTKNLWESIVRIAVKQARQVTDDQEALTLKPLYKQWEFQLGKQLNVGEYLQHGDKLYKVLQQHIVQENWIPGVGTESIYMVIDKEHEGTINDPIPWFTNMECFQDKYYIEDNILYLCIRNSEIAIHHKVIDLIGDYFEVYVIDEEIENDDNENKNNQNDNLEFEEIPIIEGTIDNPIDVTNVLLPINYEMDKYYKEGENVYKCIRTETLHFYPSSLVGHYFEIL